MKTINVEIKGITPLLMHRLAMEMLEPGGNRQNKNLTPRELAEPYAYKNKQGELYIPADAIFAAIKYGGKFHKLGKNKITTNKASLICSYIQIEEIECLLGTKEFEVDSRPVTNQALGGARVISHRPRIDKWDTKFTISLDDEPGGITDKLLYDIVADAGKKAGILSFRPSCGGQFGKFVITKWAIKK